MNNHKNDKTTSTRQNRRVGVQTVEKCDYTLLVGACRKAATLSSRRTVMLKHSRVWPHFAYVQQ